MPRSVLIAFDHSEPSRRAFDWVLSHEVLLPQDAITIATVVNEDLLAVEGMYGWETATMGTAEWMADDYYKRVSELEQLANNALNKLVLTLETKNVCSSDIDSLFSLNERPFSVPD